MLQQESNIYDTNIYITESTWIPPVAIINTFNEIFFNKEAKICCPNQHRIFQIGEIRIIEKKAKACPH